MAVTYSVFVEISNPDKEQSWIDWLRGGHIDDVKKGGATDAVLVKHDPEEERTVALYEVRYRFESRETFNHYGENYAPALRTEGLQKFPTEYGFAYKRSVGEIIEEV